MTADKAGDHSGLKPRRPSVRSLRTLRAAFERKLDRHGELPILIRQNCTRLPAIKVDKLVFQLPELKAVIQQRYCIRENLVRDICYLLPDNKNYDLRVPARLGELAIDVVSREYRKQFLRSYSEEFVSNADDWWQFIVEIGLQRRPDCGFKLKRIYAYGHPGFKSGPDTDSGWYAWHIDCHSASMQIIDWLLDLAEQEPLKPNKGQAEEPSKPSSTHDDVDLAAMYSDWLIYERYEKNGLRSNAKFVNRYPELGLTPDGMHRLRGRVRKQKSRYGYTTAAEICKELRKRKANIPENPFANCDRKISHRKKS